MATNEEKNTFDNERAKEQYSEYYREAEKTLQNNDKDKTMSIIEKALRLLKKTAVKSIKVLQEDILLMLDVLKDYISGRYKKIPFKTLAMILAAVTYFSWPFDLIFDMIPVIGFIDDVAVITMTLKFAHDDLQAYKVWKTTLGEETQANSGTVQQV